MHKKRQVLWTAFLVLTSVALLGAQVILIIVYLYLLDVSSILVADEAFNLLGL